MKELLRKLLGISTWQIMLVNPGNISNVEAVFESVKHLPVIIVLTDNVSDIEFVDTHIVAKKKKREEVKEEVNNG
jgi:hypothetical protein